MAEKEWFSMNGMVKANSEKSVRSIKATKRATNKANKNGDKYVVKIVNGVKHMVLR